MASKILGWSLLALALAGCAGSPRFPLAEPLRRDADQQPIARAPEPYYSPFAWDGANQSVFRPAARFFAVDPAGPATNVNALDEVPDSSWFTNRLGARKVTAAEARRGGCSEKQLVPSMPDGSWLVDDGKENGANPGFRVNVPGVGKFMLKSDPKSEPDRATGATAVASRVYHAVGYFAPCDTVVYIRPSLLRLQPGLTVTNNQGKTFPFDRARLDALLAGAAHRDGLVRLVASEWLPGKPLGPYRYDGRRDDDPNDVIPHEDRRELRGARLLAAWLGHFDAREQNTMDVFMATDQKGRGYVRHYIMDLGDCFGSVWSSDDMSRRLNHSYMLDVPYIAEDFVTLGLLERPWERARQETEVFNYFSARDFDPELWRGEYPNPAFGRMTEADGAWMARILARFSDELVRAVVEVGQYEPASERYLIRTLIARRDAILKRYLTRLSPLTDVTATARSVCATDLAREAGLMPGPARVCSPVRHLALSATLPAQDPARYRIIELRSDAAASPLRAHIYDLGPERGYQLAGIER